MIWNENQSLLQSPVVISLGSWVVNFRQVRTPRAPVTLWNAGERKVAVTVSKTQISSNWAWVSQGEIAEGEEAGILISASQNRQQRLLFHSKNVTIRFNGPVCGTVRAWFLCAQSRGEFMLKLFLFFRSLKGETRERFCPQTTLCWL